MENKNIRNRKFFLPKKIFGSFPKTNRLLMKSLLLKNILATNAARISTTTYAPGSECWKFFEHRFKLATSTANHINHLKNFHEVEV